MNDRWELISDLFHAALRCPPEDRPAFLRQACGHDSALQEEIESLLRRDPDVTTFLETPVAEMEIWRHGLADPTRMLGRQLGPYQIVALLGVGGMGEVYRARDLKLARDVAIKILPSQFTTDQEYRARFTREAHILASLSHPHIGVIYGLEEVDGSTALVLDPVEGPTLADRLASEPLATTEALGIGLQIGDALHAAHIKGIVHRAPGSDVWSHGDQRRSSTLQRPQSKKAITSVGDGLYEVGSARLATSPGNTWARMAAIGRGDREHPRAGECHSKQEDHRPAAESMAPA
jgi:protein kinase-like protein